MKFIYITLSGKEYKIKPSFRVFVLLEEMTGLKADQIDESVTSLLKVFYCMLKANNLETFTATFDGFLDLLDENESAFEDFKVYMQSLENKSQAPEKKSAENSMTMLELYALVVVNTGITPVYFLDHMTWPELNAIIKQVENNFKTTWEQTRQLATKFVNCFSDKEIKATELMPFSWEKQIKESAERPHVNPEHVKRMEALVNKIATEPGLAETIEIKQ